MRSCSVVGLNQWRARPQGFLDKQLAPQGGHVFRDFNLPAKERNPYASPPGGIELGFDDLKEAGLPLLPKHITKANLFEAAVDEDPFGFGFGMN